MDNNNVSEISNIGKRIQKLREKKGLSQAELAKELNVKQQTVNQWEKGERDLKTGYTIALAKYFNVTADYILCLEDCTTHAAENIKVVTGLTDDNINILKHYCKDFSESNQDNSINYLDIVNMLINKTAKEGVLFEIGFLSALANQEEQYINSPVYDNLVPTLYAKRIGDKVLNSVMLNMKDIIIQISNYNRLDKNFKLLYSQWIDDNKEKKHLIKQLDNICSNYGLKNIPYFSEIIEEMTFDNIEGAANNGNDKKAR